MGDRGRAAPTSTPLRTGVRIALRCARGRTGSPPLLPVSTTSSERRQERRRSRRRRRCTLTPALGRVVRTDGDIELGAGPFSRVSQRCEAASATREFGSAPRWAAGCCCAARHSPGVAKRGWPCGFVFMYMGGACACASLKIAGPRRRRFLQSVLRSRATMVGIGITAGLSPLASAARAENSALALQRNRFDRAAELAEDVAQCFRLDAERALERQRHARCCLGPSARPHPDGDVAVAGVR